MIIQKKVNIKINSRNYNYYKNIINDIHNGSIYEIDTINLYEGSHTKILVECDICHEKSFKPYRQYLESFNKYSLFCCSPKCAQIKNKKTNIQKYGCENVFENQNIKNKISNTNKEKYGKCWMTQTNLFLEKSKITNKERYGTENVAQSETIKSKMKRTCLEKYGVDNYFKSEKMKEFRIKNGKKIPDELKSDWIKYLDDVRSKTNSNKKKLFENWNGIDYYDGEHIKENLKLFHGDKNYPTIDHKISIYYGFVNNIDSNVISGLDNLCITKRFINSSKHTKSFRTSRVESTRPSFCIR